jgi:hypothetical protein
VPVSVAGGLHANEAGGEAEAGTDFDGGLFWFALAAAQQRPANYTYYS